MSVDFWVLYIGDRMKDTLLKRIEALSNEAGSLVNRREHLHRSIQEIEIRLHQIAGAITELDTIVKGDNGEVVQADRSKLSKNSEKTDDAEAST